jgi:hypothetical protein
MHDFKKHLETRLKRINEQRDGKKDAAKKKFKSMKAKWDDNEKLVTCIICAFGIFINWLHSLGSASRRDFKQPLESQEGRKNSHEEDPRNRTACSNPAGRPGRAHPSRRYVRDRRRDCMFSLFKLHPYKLWDSIASIKATTARVIASLISRNNNAVSLTMNRELMPK